jgi:hypothetical protein
MQPVYTNIYKIFLPISRMEDHFRNLFCILAEQLSQISSNETPAHNMSFPVESPSFICAVL